MNPALRAMAACTGDVIQGKRVVSEFATLQRNAMIEPGTRVVQALRDSPDAGCGPASADHAE